MEPGQEPTRFLMRADEATSEQRRVRKNDDEDEKRIANLNGLTQEYTIERRMLEGETQEPSREHIERVINNQYQRLQREKSDAGTKALVAAAKPGQQKP